jgi:hypothetical protein
VLYAAESSCSLAARSWSGFSAVTPVVDPAAGTSVGVLSGFLPIDLGVAGPGAVSVTDPAQADALLGVGGTNELKNLRAQTLATRLNVGAGALDPAVVAAELAQADVLLGAHAPGSWGRLDPATQAQITELAGELKSMNVPAVGCPAQPQAARLAVPTTFALGGVVTDACSGAPVKALNVTVESTRDPGPQQLPVSHSQFGVQTLAPGSYDLTISATGHNTVTLPGVEIPASQGSPLSGGFADGSLVAVSLEPLAGCPHGAKDPGPMQFAAVSGQIIDKCNLTALGGTASLVNTAGALIPTTISGNLFSVGELAAGTYNMNETVPGYQPVTYTGGTLPAVQMPAQPETFADGSRVRLGLIILVEPQPVGATC